VRGLQVPAVEKHRFISLILIEQLMFFVNTLLWHEKRQEKSWVLRNGSKLSSIEKLIRFVRLMWTRRRFRLWCMFYVTCGLNRFWANLLKNLFQHFEIFFLHYSLGAYFELYWYKFLKRGRRLKFYHSCQFYQHLMRKFCTNILTSKITKLKYN